MRSLGYRAHKSPCEPTYPLSTKTKHYLRFYQQMPSNSSAKARKTICTSDVRHALYAFFGSFVFPLKFPQFLCSVTMATMVYWSPHAPKLSVPY